MIVSERVPVRIVAAMLGLVVVATANLTGLGIGSLPLLYDAIALPRLAVTLILTPAAWAAWFLVASRNGWGFRVDAVWALLAALASWSVVSLALSRHAALGVLGQSERLEGAVIVALYALLYGLGLQVVRGTRDVRLLLSALGVATGLMAIYGVAQYAGFDPFDYSIESYSFDARRAFATLGNPTFLAGLLVLALPPIGALALEADSIWRKIAWGLGMVLALAALLATFSRGAWLAAAVQLPLCAAILWRKRGSVVRRDVVTLLVAGGFVVALLAVSSIGAAAEINLVDRVVAAVEGAGSTRERALVAETAVDAVRAKPITGHGPDAFLSAFRLHRSDAFAAEISNSSTINNAHSWPLQFAATLGLPGAILLVAAVVLALARGARSIFSTQGENVDASPPSEGSAQQDLLFPAAWVGCIGFAVHMLTGVSVLGSTVPFWLLIGVVGAPLARSGVVNSFALRAALMIAVATSIIAIAVVSLLLRADATYLDSRAALHGVTVGDSVSLARDARSLNPLSVKYARGAAQASAARVHDSIVQGAGPTIVRGLYESALMEFEVILDLDSSDYATLAWLAALQARAGRYLEDEALLAQSRATAQRAARLDRQHHEVGTLADGDTSDESILRASNVAPLP